MDSLQLSAFFPDARASVLELMKPLEMTRREVNYYCDKPRKNIFQDIHHIWEIFENAYKESMRRILITSDPGLGKSFLLKAIALLWCDTHSAETSNAESYSLNSHKNTKKILLEYSHLFYISLGNVPKDTSIEELVLELFKDTHSSVVQNILKEQRCLILLDDVNLSQRYFKHTTKLVRSSKTLHPNSTILITAYPMDLADSHFTALEIQCVIELKGIKQETVRDFASKVFSAICRNYRQKSSLEMFLVQMNLPVLKNIKHVPVIINLAIGVWLKQGKDFRSRTDLYTNIILEMLSLDKVRGQSVNFCRYFHPAEVPSFLRNCKMTFSLPLFFRLGRFSYELFTKHGDLYVFDEQLLIESIGSALLSVCKGCGLFKEKFYKMSFIHQSFQEYFAGVYISMHGNSRRSKLLLDICSKRNNVPKYRDIFQFVGGLCPLEVFTVIEAVEQMHIDISEMSIDDKTDMFERFSNNKPSFEILREAVTCDQSLLFSNKRVSMRTVSVENSTDVDLLHLVETGSVQRMYLYGHELTNKMDVDIFHLELRQLITGCLTTIKITNAKIKRSELLSIMCDFIKIIYISLNSVKCYDENTSENTPKETRITNSKEYQIFYSPDALVGVSSAPNLTNLCIHGRITETTIFFASPKLDFLELNNVCLSHSILIHIMCNMDCLKTLSLTKVQCEADDSCGCKGFGMTCNKEMRLFKFYAEDISHSVTRHLRGASQLTEIRFVSRKRDFDSYPAHGFPISGLVDASVSLASLTSLVLKTLRLKHLEITSILCSVKTLISVSLTDIVCVVDDNCGDSCSKRKTTNVKEIGLHKTESVNVICEQNNGLHNIFNHIAHAPKLEKVEISGIQNSHDKDEMLGILITSYVLTIAVFSNMYMDIMYIRGLVKNNKNSVCITLCNIRPIYNFTEFQNWLTEEQLDIDEWEMDIDREYVNISMIRFKNPAPAVSICLSDD